jgi:hypothetical protein
VRGIEACAQPQRDEIAEWRRRSESGGMQCRNVCSRAGGRRAVKRTMLKMRRMARRRVRIGRIDGCQETGATDLQREPAVGRGHEARRYQGAERQRHQQHAVISSRRVRLLRQWRMVERAWYAMAQWRTTFAGTHAVKQTSQSAGAGVLRGAPADFRPVEHFTPVIVQVMALLRPQGADVA